MKNFFITMGTIASIVVGGILVSQLNADSSAPPDNSDSKAVESQDGAKKGVPNKSEWAIPDKYKDLVPDDYRSTYHRLTGYDFSGLHWKQYIMIFMNKNPDVYVNNYLEYVRLYLEFDEDEDDFEDEEKQFEEYEIGTILLKEHFSNNDGKPGSPLTNTLMIKREKGYDPEGGDWHYVQFDTTGKIIMEGNSQRSKIKSNCSECHSNMAERDYVFTTFNSRMPAGSDGQ